MLLDTLVRIVLIIYLAASVGLLVYGINAHVMIALHWRSRRRQARADRQVRTDHDLSQLEGPWPRVTTQLPIYNERYVVARLLEAVCAMDYPRGRHEIQVLDDSTDVTSEIIAGLVAARQADGFDIHHVRRQDRTGFKAGALAAGLAVARGEFVAIFDADFLPPPDFLRNTMPFLLADPRCCFVQTRWGHCNRRYSLLTELQSLGIDGHFVVEQAARAWNNLFFNFNGTAGVWRVAAITDAGGWTADTVTEDLDLSYRALLGGWRPRYLWDVVTPAEVPADINAFKSQQSRWATGSIQCALKLLPQVLRRRDLAAFKRLQAVLHLTHYLIHPLILIMTVLVWPLIHLLGQQFGAAFTAPLVVLILIALTGPSSLYIVSQAVSGGDWRRALLLMPALIAVGIGLAVNNTAAVLRALRQRRGGEFVRTPKQGVGISRFPGHATPGAYRQPLNRLVALELMIGLWAAGACASYVITMGQLGGLFVLIQAVGFGVVGSLSFVHERRNRRASTPDPGP